MLYAIYVFFSFSVPEVQSVNEGSIDCVEHEHDENYIFSIAN